MLFASDLDETLIYSGRFLQEDCLKTSEIRLIETKDGKAIAYMTEAAIKTLKSLSQKVIFVPVTTRSIEQYQRITLFQKEIPPQYAIVSNGGNLLIDGSVDEGWNTLIREKVKKHCLPLKEILVKFREIHPEDWVTSQKMADDLFCYAIVDQDRLPQEELCRFIEWLKENHWEGYLQRRKLYFVPKVVNKKDAIEYLINHIDTDFTVAAGDSLMDVGMLKQADYSITPLHGEIARLYQKDIDKEEKIQVTSATGILASEEILKNIENLIACFQKLA
ncbi:hypothetical protein CACET_c32930 [Clostridium aceticum]|uniref:Uncharacterized protein n=1 Tax=Clostridium aceticum TaxID=84022 RepID=A0A0D8IC15_9CLOT|nr:HAD hydrolase family protein [Clostridium aceticum]AKL96737.1 hypothetical protein CACET_c32930 [Clostridium aceticum]KJF27502.1 hypothetical protein TZ02_06820 [Clostridium aceticum]